MLRSQLIRRNIYIKENQKEEQAKKMVSRGTYTHLLRKSAPLLVVALLLFSNIAFAVPFDGTQGSHDTLFTNEIDSKGPATINVLKNLNTQGDVAATSIHVGTNGLTIGGETFTQLSNLGAFTQSGTIASFVDGDVGIGTTTPDRLLHVAGFTQTETLGVGSTFNGADAAWVDITVDTLDADGEPAVRLTKSGPSGGEYVIRLKENNLETFDRVNQQVRMTLDDQGNVGIGTTNPDTELEVVGTTLTNKLRLADTGSNSKWWDIQEESSNRLILAYRNAAGAIMPGMVGIGTATPSTALEVDGTIKATAFELTGGGSIAGASAWQESQGNAFRDSGNVGIGTDSPQATLELSAETENQPLIILTSTTDSIGVLGETLLETKNDAHDAHLKIFGGGTIAQFLDGTNAGTIINSSGNSYFLSKIGIGTSSPDTNLDIQSADGEANKIELNQEGQRTWHLGTHATNPSFKIHDASVGEDRVTIDTDGNVGIGTTTPTQKLQVAGTTQTDKLRLSDTGNNNIYWDLQEESNNDLTFKYMNEKVRITAMGNVGIGTTPTEKLEVAGKIKGTELCIGTDCRDAWPVAGTTTSTTGATVSESGTPAKLVTQVKTFTTAPNSPTRFSCDEDERVLSCESIAVPSGDKSCVTGITSDGKTCNYGGCTGSNYHTTIVCGKVTGSATTSSSGIAGLERVTNSCPNTGICEVSCSSGKKILGGGCNIGGVALHQA